MMLMTIQVGESSVIDRKYNYCISFCVKLRLLFLRFCNILNLTSFFLLFSQSYFFSVKVIIIFCFGSEVLVVIAIPQVLLTSVYRMLCQTLFVVNINIDFILSFIFLFNFFYSFQKKNISIQTTRIFYKAKTFAAFSKRNLVKTNRIFRTNRTTDFNPLQPAVAFLYLLKTSENIKVV